MGELKSKTQGRSGTILLEKKDAHDDRAREGPDNIVPFNANTFGNNESEEEYRRAA